MTKRHTDYINKELKSILGSREVVFSEIVKLTRLNPRTDFRNINLNYVNFNKSDLRGYDFRGSDLSSTSWSGAIIDRTTLYDKEYSFLAELAQEVEEDDAPGFIRSDTT